MTTPQTTMQPLLVAESVRFGFPQRPEFLGPVSLTISPGDLWVIVGPNGAGKSTLMRLLAGLLVPQGGTVTSSGVRLADFAPRARARRIAFVPQNINVETGISVRELVLLGCYPWRSLAFFESAEDHHIAEEAMAATQTLTFAQRAVSSLSGGEAQRVHLAAALAQRAPLLLLDEPTASLDLRHQIEFFQILRRRSAQDGLAVVVVSHDINLAAAFATKALVLGDGRVRGVGDPRMILTPELLGPVFGLTLESLTLPRTPGRRWLVPQEPEQGGAR